MHIIIRVEDVDKMGYYCGNIPTFKTPFSERHPGPCDDSKLSPYWEALEDDAHKYVFGFNSWEQFRAWFYIDHWLTDYFSLGGGIGIYLVADHHIIAGHTQSVFVSEKSKRLDWLQDLDSLRFKYLKHLTFWG